MYIDLPIHDPRDDKTAEYIRMFGIGFHMTIRNTLHMLFIRYSHVSHRTLRQDISTIEPLMTLHTSPSCHHSRSVLSHHAPSAGSAKRFILHVPLGICRGAAPLAITNLSGVLQVFSRAVFAGTPITSTAGG